MNVERHPVRGTISGLLMGFGLAVMAVIYGVIPLENLLLPGAITLGFGVIGGTLAMLWPTPDDMAFD